MVRPLDIGSIGLKFESLDGTLHFASEVALQNDHYWIDRCHEKTQSSFGRLDGSLVRSLRIGFIRLKFESPVGTLGFASEAALRYERYCVDGRNKHKQTNFFFSNIAAYSTQHAADLDL